jgi:hypothetical protein
MFDEGVIVPDRTLFPLDRPPRLVDRWWLHTAHTLVAAWSILVGVDVVVAQLIGHVSVGPTLDVFPEPIQWAAGIMAIIGGTAVLLAIYCDTCSHSLDTAWVIERAGWTLIVTAFTAFAVSVIMFDFDHVTGALLRALVAAIGAARLWELQKIAERAEAGIQAAQTEGAPAPC